MTRPVGALTVEGLDAGAPRWAELRRLAAVLALKQTADGRFFAGHWRRGPVLYELVQRVRPHDVLEFGTGRGFGAVCMAKAALDAGLACTVWTIDAVPPGQPQPWALDEGRGPEVRSASLNEVWGRHVPEPLRSRIRCLTGDSVRVMRGWAAGGLPRVQLCFVDGGHDDWTVKHDFIAALRVADRHCAFLFDDYAVRPGYGVKRLVDEEIRPRLAPEAVEVFDVISHDRGAAGQDTAHEMALVHGEDLGERPLARFYTAGAVRAFERRLAVVRGLRQIRAGAGAARRRLRGA